MTSAFHFVAHYLRPYRRSTVLLAVVIIVSILLQIATPLLTARFIDRALAGEPVRDLLTIAAATLLLAVVRQLFAVGETLVAERLSWSATNALRLDLAAHVLALDYRFHAAHAQGTLIERVDGDTGQLARFFSRFAINIIGNGFLAIAILALLVATHWQIGAAIAAIVTIALITMLRIRSRATPAWTEERRTSASVYGFLSEYLDGLEDIRAGGEAARRFVLRRFVGLMRGWLAISTRARMWGYALMATNVGVFTLALAVALGLGGYLYGRNALTLGGIFLVVRLTDMLREPIARLRDEVQELQRAAASLTRVRALLAEQPGIVDGTGAPLPSGALSIEWSHITFGYGDDPAVVRDITLRVTAGRVLGVVGRTGSGKSTLTRFVPRFIDPDSGAMLVGGVDVRQLRLADLRARIAVVSQDVQLFDGTLRDNLTFFAANDTATDARLTATLDRLGLGEWLRSLPAGLDTRLGDGGTGLSAGQEQLVSCARALLRDPDIVILDEASARLDPASERLLHDALSALLAGRTGVIVAHRLDTLAFADDIAVIADGQLIEHGSRPALAADPASRFSALLHLDRQETAR